MKACFTEYSNGGVRTVSMQTTEFLSRIGYYWRVKETLSAGTSMCRRVGVRGGRKKKSPGRRLVVDLTCSGSNRKGSIGVELPKGTSSRGTLRNGGRKPALQLGYIAEQKHTRRGVMKEGGYTEGEGPKTGGKRTCPVACKSRM